MGRAGGGRDHRLGPRRFGGGPLSSQSIRLMLNHPRPALAEQSSFIGYLVGLAGLASAVRVLAGDGHSRTDNPREPDDFAYLLLGVASLGDAINRLAESG